MISWKKNKYHLINENKEVKIEDIDFFDRNYEYNFTNIGYLGKGFYGIVDKYKVEIIDDDGTVKEAYLAGKRFYTINIEEIRMYILRIFHLKKKLRNISVALKIIDTQYNVQKYVDIKMSGFFGKFFGKTKVDLSHILFLTDLTTINGVKEVFAINNGNYINEEFLKYSYSKRCEVYKLIIDDIFLLWKNGFHISNIDLWILAINSNGEISPYMVDVDRVSSKPINHKSFKSSFQIIILTFFDKLGDFVQDDMDFMLIYFNEKYNKIYSDK